MAQFIEPDDRLKKKFEGQNPAKIFSERDLANAEKAVQNHEHEFDKKWTELTKGLREQFETCQAAEFKNAEEVDALRDIVMDIKANAGMFEYDMATSISWSLYQCLSHDAGEFDGAQIKLVAALVRALELIFKQRLKGDGGEIGKAINSEVSGLLAKNPKAIKEG